MNLKLEGCVIPIAQYDVLHVYYYLISSTTLCSGYYCYLQLQMGKIKPSDIKSSVQLHSWEVKDRGCKPALFSSEPWEELSKMGSGVGE